MIKRYLLLYLLPFFYIYAQMDRHMEYHKQVQKGPKMELIAATFFGTESVEEFVGVTVMRDDNIVAVGNSWGPPFPSYIGDIKVLGIDNLYDLPLYPPGVDVHRAPPQEHPNRTGFIVFYSSDLSKIVKCIRFGWGLASITAVKSFSDGGLVIGGNSTQNFRAFAAKIAKKIKFLPSLTGEGYGPFKYIDVTLPGDVYVGKMSESLSEFEWLYIFEGYRNAPEHIYEGKNGEVVFRCHGIRRISKDGENIFSITNQSFGDRRHFLGVNPLDGTWAVGGDHHHGTGREPWRRPICVLFTSEGEMLARLYDWHGPLVGHDDFRLVSDSAIRGGNFLPNGHLVLYGWSDGGNSVLARNPVDLARPAKSTGLGFSAWGAGVGSFAHIARFDPKNYEDCSYTFWCSYMQTMPNSITISFFREMKNGSIVVAGFSANWLVQTTIKWYRAPNQYLMDCKLGSPEGPIIYQKNGWPIWTGVGGRGGYVTVFSHDFKMMLWSSAISHCTPMDAAECGKGLVVVSRCEATVNDRKQQGRDPMFNEHDIANWLEFIKFLRKQAEDSIPSPGKQVWKLISEDVKKLLEQVNSDEDITDELKKQILDEFNVIVANSFDFFDEEAWKDYTHEKAGIVTPLPVIEYEKDMINKLKEGKLEQKDLPEVNRVLFELAFPQYVFRCPKMNRPPAVNAIQRNFGGGFSDGHIYLLARPAKMED